MKNTKKVVVATQKSVVRKPQTKKAKASAAKRINILRTMILKTWLLGALTACVIAGFIFFVDHVGEMPTTAVVGATMLLSATCGYLVKLYHDITH